MEAISDRISEGQLGLVAALHYHNRLKILLEGVIKLTPFPEKQVQKFNAFAMPFLNGLPIYKDVYKVLKSKCNLMEEYKFDKSYLHFDNRKTVLTKFLDVTRKELQPYERAK